MPRPSPSEMIVPAPESTRNLGRLLLLVGCMLCLMGTGLFVLWPAEARSADMFRFTMAASLATTVLLFTCGLLQLGRRERIRVGEGRVTIASGRRSRTIVVGDQPLVEIEESRRSTATGPVFSWGIYVASTRERVPIVVRDEYFLEFRNLAEMLAKGLGCRLVDRSAGVEPVTLEPEDLDLPFAERVKRRPDLLGEPPARPPRLKVRVEDAEGTRTFTWRGSLLRSLVVVLPFPLLFLAFLGLPAYAPGWLPVDLGLETYRGLLLLLGLLTLLACMLPLSYGARLAMGPERLDFEQRVAGVVLVRQSIPWSELEEVRVHVSGGATRVELFSDRQEIRLGSTLDPVGERDVAAWLAAEIRGRAAGREA